MPFRVLSRCCSIFLIFCCGAAIAQQSQVDTALTRAIDTVIRIASALHPGMTRADVLKNFQTEGGISARQWNSYVYKRCPYIKVDVTFAVAPGQDQMNEAATDKIATVSKPYLQFSVSD
jgi:hypothetical protein